MPETQITEMVNISRLSPHPDNKRQGDIGAIMQMIVETGWHGATVLQRKGRELIVLAGWHRSRALDALARDGWTDPETGERLTYEELARQVTLPPKGKVPADILRIDDEVALKKVLQDNRANDLAGYDDQGLAEVLRALAEEGGDDALRGTGYDGDDLDQLLRDLDTSVTVPAQDARTVAERAGVYNSTDVRQIVIVMSPAEFARNHDILEAAMEMYELDTHSDAAQKVWQLWADDNDAHVSRARQQREAEDAAADD